jgi:hypothetical protein
MKKIHIGLIFLVILISGCQSIEKPKVIDNSCQRLFDNLTIHWMGMIWYEDVLWDELPEYKYDTLEEDKTLLG